MVALSAAARALIERGALAHLSCVNPDGSPHVSCVWIGFDGDDLVFGSLGPWQKLRNLERDPRVVVSLESDTANEMGMTEYLVVQGTATVTHGGAPELLQRLAHVYLGPEVVFPPMSDPPPGSVVRIAIEKVTGVGPWVD